ncbi:hypothetical protein [Rhodopseudomonas palustris]|uniref:Uncharacterized protein n=1 Tax=Rhodopseudomonas palustris TaxID=1076 RepID=A0A418VGA9_RHOPL|nr:hypothetical protein [Rhodopseudomonas palustris]RJF75155.1 hypothetical protein D4Q52_10980 [Rhodopseudomonas palustris]
MNKIVRENYPVSALPADLREGLAGPVVTVTIEEGEQPPKQRPTLDEIFARRQPPFRSKEEIDAEWRRQRDEWE